MKKFFIFFSAVLFLACCGKNPSGPTEPEGPVVIHTPVPEFAKGADISWVTEMESKGYKFYSADGTQTECTLLMKQLGCNAMRYRVWVDPAGGWCNKEDVLVKAKRAQALGLAIMIDFHYADSWCDPGKQPIPAAWQGKNLNDMITAVSEHTTEVLTLLKNEGVDVAWVQVGNETNTGMLWEIGRLSSTNYRDFCLLANGGYNAVKAVYPDALVILHHSNAQDLNANKWFYNLVKTGGAKYDMIGLSLYPSYWADGGYPDWTPYCTSAVANVKTLHDTYGKPVMLVEFGMPASEPAKAKAALQFVMDGVKDYDWFKGIFYWEPESEQSRNNYGYGAFSGGRATIALDPFKN